MYDQLNRSHPYQSSNFSRQTRFDDGIDAKVVIMGSTGVGKTSLLHRYAQNKFDPKNTTSTTGALFVTKKVIVSGIKVRLQLWDTAGQERFRSMAPMYYRGANAAILMYDITNSSSFDAIRGWLQELKKNCDSELIIYIVGAKGDLHRHRQVTSDIARHSLHTWFPPARSPSPTPPPPPPSSTLSYIRPRFTSFPSMIPTVPPTSASPTSTDDSNACSEPVVTRSSALQRSNSSAIPRPPPPKRPSRQRANTMNSGAGPPRSRFGSHFGIQINGWNETGDSSSNSLNEDDEDRDDESTQEWGLGKDMELFEVSAKDDVGIQSLFDSVISTIIAKKDIIETQNEVKRRDSVFLTEVSTPAWAAQAAEEEAKQKVKSSGSWSCC